MTDRPEFTEDIQKILHWLQLIASMFAVVLYTQHLNNAAKTDKGLPAKPVYAVVTGYTTCITATVYLLLAWWQKKHTNTLLESRTGWYLPLFVWEWILVTLWSVVLGLFGKMYLGSKVGDSDEIRKMKRAAWVDLANLILWVVTGSWKSLKWWKSKGKRVPRRNGRVRAQRV